MRGKTSSCMSKLSFRRRPSYRNSVMPGGVGLGAAAVALAIAVVITLHFFAPGLLTRAVRPFANFGAMLGNETAATVSLDSKEALREERDRLASENVALSERAALLSTQLADLTRLLGTRTEPEKGIVASVRARPPVAPYDVLVTDQGSLSGVTLGAVAYGPGGTPIGTVGAVSSSESRIALYSTRALATEGWAGSARIPLTLTGEGAGAFSATVAREAGVAVGDGVYVAGNGVSPIGTIVAITSDASSPSVELEVRPYTNPFSLTWVTIAQKL